MLITKKSLKIQVENLGVKVETMTGKNPHYKLLVGDAGFYSIGREYGMTLCSFMSAKELDVYIFGIYKGFAILGN